MAHVIGNHSPSVGKGLVPAMAKAYLRWRKRRVFERFAHDDPSAVERLARDLNLDKASLLAVVAQGDAASDLLKRWLHALGLDPGRIAKRDPAVARDLARCCALCSSKRRCARHLAHANRAAWESYCPNKPTLDALVADVAMHASNEGNAGMRATHVGHSASA